MTNGRAIYTNNEGKQFSVYVSGRKLNCDGVECCIINRGDTFNSMAVFLAPVSQVEMIDDTNAADDFNYVGSYHHY